MNDVNLYDPNVNPNTVELQKEILLLLDELDRKKKYAGLANFYPETGKFSRDLYPRHMEFVKAGASYMERAFVAANRIGKTVTGAWEMAIHLTGRYPKGWQGRRFNRPIQAWAAGLTHEATRDYIQRELFGSFNDPGTGMIPKDCIDKISNKALPNAIGYARIKHYDADGVFDGYSEIALKAYNQGWENFQGTKMDVIWLDEEPADQRIYTECLTRIAGTEGDDVEPGMIYCTFTPLLGMSEIYLQFMPGGRPPKDGVQEDIPDRYTVNATFDDVPHLSTKWKEAFIAALPPHLRGPKTMGLAAMGSGNVFPIPEEVITYSSSFRPPAHWPRAFGMDFGWNNPTACVWAAKDPDSGVLYLYSEHYESFKEAPFHAAAIKQRGKWIIGACDPSGLNKGGAFGHSYAQAYYDLDIALKASRGGGTDTSKEVRISKARTMLEEGLIKVAEHLQHFFKEYRMYRYDENGKIHKKDDHLMDAFLYLISEFDLIAQVNPECDDEYGFYDEDSGPVSPIDNSAGY